EPDAAHGEVDDEDGRDDHQEVDRVRQEPGDDAGALPLHPPRDRGGGRHAHDRSSGPSSPLRPINRSRSREIARSAFILWTRIPPTGPFVIDPRASWMSCVRSNSSMT